MGFILAEEPLAGTQLVRSRWFSAEILGMSYWVPGENDGQQNVVEDGSWASYETTWRQVSHSKRRCVRHHQTESGKSNPSKSKRPFSASEKNTFMYRWCNKPRSCWKARTLGSNHFGRGCLQGSPLWSKAFETGCYLNKFTERRRLKVRDVLPITIRTYKWHLPHGCAWSQNNFAVYLYLRTSFKNSFKLRIVWCQNWGHLGRTF